MPRHRHACTESHESYSVLREVDVWQLSIGLIKQVYRLCDRLPRSEVHCLADQLHRAAVSVALNIAEGRAADSDAEFRRFLGFSLKSVVEVSAAALICEELGMLDSREVERLRLLCDELEAKLRRFRQKLSAGARPSGIKRNASSIERT